MPFAAPSSRPLASALETVRKALVDRHAGPAAAEDPAAGREDRLLDALAEGDDSAFVYRMLLGAWGGPPTPALFDDRLATLHAGRTNRYALLEREAAQAETGASPEPPDPSGDFMARTLFHPAEFETLEPPAFLAAAFCACLKRRPDPFSLTHYLGMLQSGRLGRPEILRQLLDSDEARLAGWTTVILGLTPGDTADRIVAELTRLHRRTRQLEYLAGFMQAQQHGLAARVAALEQRV